MPDLLTAQIDALLAHAHDAIIIRRSDGEIRYWNGGAERLYGYTRAQAVGQLSHLLLRTESPGATLAAIHDELRRQGVWEGLLHHHRADGERVTVYSRWVARPDQHGGHVILEINRDDTARLHAEEELRRRNEQFQFVSEHAPVIIAHIDVERRYKFVNRAYLQRFGFTADQVVGRHIAEVAGSAAYESVRGYIDDVLQGRRVEFEQRVPYQQLGEHVVHSVFEPERDASGRVIGFVAAVLDVTDRRRAEAELKASHERQEFLIRSAGLGTFSCDLPFDTLQWNERMKAQFGLPPDARVTITTFFERLHPDDVEPTAAAIRKAIDEHSLYDVHYRVRQVDGDYRWIRAIGRAHYDADGTAQWFDGIALDVHAERRAEELLREREALFREMADDAPVVLWVTDASGTCTYLSKQWYEYTGGTPAEQPPDRWADSVHPDDLAHATQVFSGANSRQVPFTVDFRMRYRDGSYRWTVDAGMPRFNANGEFQGYVGTVVDVHERKIFEQALADADRRKDEFLATLAHELRNPLAPLVTALRLLEIADGDAKIQQRARAIMNRQLTQMTKLVDDLLDVSRITRGKFQLRPETVTLGDILQSAVEAASSLVTANAHRLEVSIPEEPIHLHGDPTRLAQIFLNLLNNAAKYTPPNGTLRLSVRREGGQAVIDVADNGIGIAPEMIGGIFEMFVQAEHSRELSQGGLGIGLTLVKRLVDLHGGSIAVRSEGLGKGSTFTVRLPALAAGAPQGAGDAQTLDAADQPRRILVADDSSDARESMELVLRRLGHDVRVARDGVEVLEIGEIFLPEVVLLDIGMPRMNGYEAARQIRMRPWGASALVVAMTGWGQPQDRERSRQAGIDHHFSKPVDPLQLQRYLQQELSA